MIGDYWTILVLLVVAAVAVVVVERRESRSQRSLREHMFDIPEHLIQLAKNETNDWRCTCGEWWIGPRSVKPDKAFEQHRRAVAK